MPVLLLDSCQLWHKPFFFQAQKTVLGYDYMVYNRNVHNFTCLDQPFSDGNIFSAGSGFAAGVVMDKDNGGAGIFYGFPEYFPRVNHGSR